jgi:hypothetical protein
MARTIYSHVEAMKDKIVYGEGTTCNDTIVSREEKTFTMNPAKFSTEQITSYIEANRNNMSNTEKYFLYALLFIISNCPKEKDKQISLDTFRPAVHVLAAIRRLQQSNVDDEALRGQFVNYDYATLELKPIINWTFSIELKKNLMTTLAWYVNSTKQNTIRLRRDENLLFFKKYFYNKEDSTIPENVRVYFDTCIDEMEEKYITEQGERCSNVIYINNEDNSSKFVECRENAEDNVNQFNRQLETLYDEVGLNDIMKKLFNYWIKRIPTYSLPISVLGTVIGDESQTLTRPLKFVDLLKLLEISAVSPESIQKDSFFTPQYLSQYIDEEEEDDMTPLFVQLGPTSMEKPNFVLFKKSEGYYTTIMYSFTQVISVNNEEPLFIVISRDKLRIPVGVDADKLDNVMITEKVFLIYVGDVKPMYDQEIQSAVQNIVLGSPDPQALFGGHRKRRNTRRKTRRKITKNRKGKKQNKKRTRKFYRKR